MKNTVIWNILKSKYCLVVFLFGLLLGYFLVPKKIFYSFYAILGAVYILIFAVMMVCIARNIKEKIVSVKNTGSSIISISASIIGLGAMQICGVGAPLCGAGIGFSIFSIIAPTASIAFFSQYSVLILMLSILLQLAALYYMGCFKKCIKGVVSNKKTSTCKK